MRGESHLVITKNMMIRNPITDSKLANRRVSFAPEATLHTWDVVELAEDATTSSEATNSTRRQSSGSTLTNSSYPQTPSQSPYPNSEEAPSTPPEEEILVAASPAHQRDLHRKTRRRSSAIPPMNFNNPEDLSSSPTDSVGSDDTHQSFVAAEDDIVDGSDSDSDKDLVAREETVTGVDNDDTTTQSTGSGTSHDSSSTGSSGKLDEALRQAAQQAGIQELQYDGNGEVSMEMADEEVTNAFKPLAAQERPKSPPKPSIARNLSSLQDQENVNPFAPTANVEQPRSESDEMTMEVTRAVGGILSSSVDANTSPKRGRRKSVAPTRRRSSAGRRRSSGDASTLEDETMEFTTAFGMINQGKPEQAAADVTMSSNNDEDMTMEFTGVVGGVVDPKENQRRQSVSFANDDDMEMTVAGGGILSPVTERTEPTDDDKTAGMDITKAVGLILPYDLRAEDKSTAKKLMEEEADHGQLTRSPFLKSPKVDSSQASKAGGKNLAPRTSDTGSPSLGRNTRRNATRLSSTSQSVVKQVTPVKKPVTPSKQLTPRPERPSTPSKTPPNKNIAMRKISPKKLFKSDVKKATVSSASPKPSGPRLEFKNDSSTGVPTPSVVLTPKPRRPSGIGIDQQGIGSPRVAALLDRRRSIGEDAANFSPQSKAPCAVRFEDPRLLKQELDRERAEDERRESGRSILQMEADAKQEDKDVTTNLKGMIQSLTPKKNKLRGRKSLHVGAAKGLLGKRPVELDEEEDSPKRIKGPDKSPVKSIHLAAPPSKEQTTGRLGKAPRFSLANASGNAGTPSTHGSPNKLATTPKDQSRFKDAEAIKSGVEPPISFNEQLAGAPAEVEPEEDQRIHLSEFLNMTSIRFMELTSTKRRHTVAPGKEDITMTGDLAARAASDKDDELASCVVAAACTVPMLELYQHVSSFLTSCTDIC